MPYRYTILECGYYYHTFSRGINKQTIFHDDWDYHHALGLIRYYSYSDKKICYSRYRKLPDVLKTKSLTSLKAADKLVDVVAFCLMPNHFHFLLRQKKPNGISKFMADFQNSYTKYSNTKKNQFGSILQTPFKAELVENDAYLLHLSRYIHLNPYSSGLTNKLSDLKKYYWSSLPEYLQKSKNPISSPNSVLAHFKDRADYQNFIFESADYQREVEWMKHLVIESE